MWEILKEKSGKFISPHLLLDLEVEKIPGLWRRKLYRKTR
jgi:hypothetical protein